VADASLLPAVLLLAVGTYAIRLGGVVFGGSRAAELIDRWSAPAVAVVLASVAATATFYDGTEFAGWARVAGVAAGAVAAAIRAPIVVVVVVAAATTAVLRLAGIP
jgi:uncharacterized membrane protein